MHYLTLLLLKVVHPSKHIRDKFPSLPGKERPEGTLKKKTINHWEQEATVFWHNKFKNIKPYATQRFRRIVEEGPELDYLINDKGSEGKTDLPMSIMNRKGLSSLMPLHNMWWHHQEFNEILIPMIWSWFKELKSFWTAYRRTDVRAHAALVLQGRRAKIRIE